MRDLVTTDALEHVNEIELRNDNDGHLAGVSQITWNCKTTYGAIQREMKLGQFIKSKSG